MKFEGCAGSGASHGGNGGSGAKLTETSKCDELHPLSYVDSD